MSADEYVEGLNDLVATTAPDLGASLTAYEQIADPTMADWAAFVEREIAIRRVFGDGFDALEQSEASPPTPAWRQAWKRPHRIAAEGLTHSRFRPVGFSSVRPIL